MEAFDAVYRGKTAECIFCHGEMYNGVSYEDSWICPDCAGRIEDIVEQCTGKHIKFNIQSLED